MRGIWLSIIFALMTAGFGHADEPQQVPPALRDGLNRWFDQVSPSKQPAPPSVPKQDLGPELPLLEPAEPFDSLGQVVIQAERAEVRTFLEVRQLWEQAPDADTRRRALERLRPLIRREPDRAVWTNYGRFTSFRRLVRELAHQWTQGQPAGRVPDLRTRSLTEIARASLRDTNAARSDRLRWLWTRARQDLGDRAVAKIRGNETLGGRRSWSPPSEARPAPEWTWQSTVSTPAWGEWVRDAQVGAGRSGQAVLPTSRPAVNDTTVVWRTARGLQAVDRQTGTVRWNVALDDSFEEFHRTKPTGRQRALRADATQWAVQVAPSSNEPQVLYGSAGRSRPVLGGAFVYVVMDEAVWTPLRLDQQSRRGMATIKGEELNANRLRAIDVRTGRTVWEIGGPVLLDGFDRPAAGTFFLGPPVVHESRLYVLAERRGDTELLVLDEGTGAIVWSMPLCSSHKPIQGDPARRFWALTPTLLGGLAICPTGQGWLVAVDTDGQELAWLTRLGKQSTNQGVQGFRGVERSLTLGQTWRVEPPFVAGERVWVFPPEALDDVASTSATCVDLFTGDVLATVPRNKSVQPVAVLEDRVVVAGADFLRVWAGGVRDHATAPTGQLLWRRRLDVGQKLSGRPVVASDRIYAPVDGVELWTIRVDDGEVISRQRLADGTLGNLSVENGELLSCGLSQLAFLRDRNDIGETSNDWTSRLRAAHVFDSIDEQLDVLAAWAGAAPRPGRVPPEFLSLARQTLDYSLKSGRTVDVGKIVDALSEQARAADDRVWLDAFAIRIAKNHGRLDDAVDRLFRVAFDDRLMSVMLDTFSDDEDVLSVRADAWVAGELKDLWSRLSAEQRATRRESWGKRLTSTDDADVLLRLAGTGLIDKMILERLDKARSVSNIPRHDAAKVRSVADIASVRLHSRDARRQARDVWADLIRPLAPNAARTSQDWSGGRVITAFPAATNYNAPSRYVKPRVARGADSWHSLRFVNVANHQTLRVESAYDGASLARIPASFNVSGAQIPQFIIDGDLAFECLSLGVTAYRLEDWSVAWKRTIEAPSLSTRISIAEMFLPLARYKDDLSRLRDRSRDLGAVVAITPEAVVVDQGETLVGVGRDHGSVLWQRRWRRNDRFIGTHEGVLIFERGRSLVGLRALDGALHTISLTPKHAVAATAGSAGLVTLHVNGYSEPASVACWTLDLAADDFETTSEDLSARPKYVARLRWSESIDRAAVVAFVPQTGLIRADVLAGESSPSGRSVEISLLSFASGKWTPPQTVTDLLRPKEKVELLAAFVDHDRVLLTLNSKARLHFHNYWDSGITRMPVGRRLVSLRLPDGELQWEAEISSGELVRGALPFDLFLEQPDKAVAAEPDGYRPHHILAFDRETGAPLIRQLRVLPNSQLRHVAFSPSERTVTLIYPSERIRFRHQPGGETE